MQVKETSSKLLSICLQVAKGMEYLAHNITSLLIVSSQQGTACKEYVFSVYHQWRSQRGAKGAIAPLFSRRTRWVVSQARPSRAERGSGEVPIVELF